MGKHNGKSRSTKGTKVGAALTRRHKDGGPGGAFQGRHTTDMGGGMQSILERNDLDELMAMAELADRDFTAERYQPVVVSTSAHTALAAEQSAAARAAAEARHAHKLCLPRRPAWDASTTAEQLDAQEKAAFLNWRRQLAILEEEEELLLTPFERNLEVWRQLWRVLERSDIVVQVVDARDPLTYFSQDLATYALELHPTKKSFTLLNKADLLPEAVRAAWADYFDAKGVQYGFWSAFAASEAQAKARHDAIAYGYSCSDPAVVLQYFQQLLGVQPQGSSSRSTRTKILSVEELLDVLERLAREAVHAAEEDDPRKHDPTRRLMVGLVGYPNVGKSSTINAIFGAKKTAVAPTPGKTKHFQTLHVSHTMCLCDCPGLVFPRFAASKAEMVAAGVIPIDRLTDVRAPIEVAAARCGQQQLEAVYGIRLPGWQAAVAATRGTSPLQSPPAAATAEVAAAAPASSSPAAGGPSSSSSGQAQQHQQLSPGTLLLLGLARARGWVASSGLPDESRAGRQILKDYTNGKLLYCKLPPGWRPPGFAPTGAPLPGTVNALPLQQGQEQPVAQKEQQQRQQMETAAAVNDAEASDDDSDSVGSEVEDGKAAAGAGDSISTEDASVLLLNTADLDLMDGLGIGLKAKPKRADHKFHKKAARSKGSRGMAADAGGYDGAAISTGKKGGLVRVGGY